MVIFLGGDYNGRMTETLTTNADGGSHEQVGTGYFDLQVNGYGGVDFNKDDLTGEELAAACKHLSAGGVDGILATFITDDVEKMAGRIAKLVELREADGHAKRLISGIHIEGPFLNAEAGYIGAHPGEAAKAANIEDAEKLIEAGNGLVKLFTLAPEVDEGMAVTQWLAKQGILVSAGHTNASVQTLIAGIEAGLGMFTHLGNGCPMTLDRHDNIVQRVLSVARQYDDFIVSFIADGVHVPYPALGNYIELLGVDQCVVVTDAIAAAGLGEGTYTLGRNTVQIGEDQVARAEDGSHLVGSAITMIESERRLKLYLGLDEADTDWLMSVNPRRIVGC